MTNEEKILELLNKLGEEQKKQGMLLEEVDKRSQRTAALLEEVDKRSERTAALLEEVDGRSKRTAALLEEVDGRSKRTAALLEEVDGRSKRTAVLLETEYRDKLQLLFDGHKLLSDKLDTLAPRDRVEVLEDEIITLKTVVKSMSKRLSALEKAQ